MPSVHTAPPVRYPVQRSPWLARALVFVALLGGLSLLAWALQGAGTHTHGWQLAAGAVLWCVVCGVAWRFWACGVCGTLAWDGQTWILQAHPHMTYVEGVVTVHLDLQVHLWLRWQSAQGVVQWLWLEQRSDQARWGDVRRAVYSRAGTLAADALQPVAQRDLSA